MKSTNAALSLTVVALLSLILCQTALADQPPDNVGGNWTIYSISIENGTTVVKQVQIAQYGNRITGYFEGPDQSGPIQGEVNGHEIRFNTVTRNVLKFSGQIYGNSMNGSYGLHGKQSTWQAVRTSGGGAEVPPATVSYNQNEQAEVVPPRPPHRHRLALTNIHPNKLQRQLPHRNHRDSLRPAPLRRALPLPLRRLCLRINSIRWLRPSRCTRMRWWHRCWQLRRIRIRSHMQTTGWHKTAT